MRCKGCGDETLVAFSCKGRGFPPAGHHPSQGTATHLLERVLPHVPTRQWVVSLPRQSAGLSRRRRIPEATVSEVLRLRRELYKDFSTRHLHEHLVERHQLAVSYTFVRDLLQLHGLADNCGGVGRYLRKRQPRPVPGMLLHLDASMHE